MLKYATKRLGLALVIALLSVTLLFIIIHMIPGDPARTMLGPRATPELIADLEARMGLDQPLPIQILIFFGNMARGDLGMDMFSNRPVATIVFEQLPYTLALIVASITWSAILGIFLGCFSAVRRNSLADRITGVLFREFHCGTSLRHCTLFPAAVCGEAQMVPGHRRRRAWQSRRPALASGLAQLCHWPVLGGDTLPGWCGPPCWRSWVKATCAPPGRSACLKTGSPTATRYGWRSCPQSP